MGKTSQLERNSNQCWFDEAGLQLQLQYSLIYFTVQLITRLSIWERGLFPWLRTRLEIALGA